MHDHRELERAGHATVKASGTVTVGGVQIARRDQRLRRSRHQQREDVGRRADHDRHERDEPGRPRAHVHRLRREERRHAAGAPRPASRSTRRPLRLDHGRHLRPDRADERERRLHLIVNSTSPGTATVNASGTVTVGGVASWSRRTATAPTTSATRRRGSRRLRLRLRRLRRLRLRRSICRSRRRMHRIR